MMSPQSLPWQEPLELAAAIDELYWVLLYSGVQSGDSGRYSYLACSLAERVEGADFFLLQDKMTADTQCFDNAWFGYLGYGLKDGLETLIPDSPNWLELSNLCMMRFHTVYQFDHQERVITCWSDIPVSYKTKAVQDITLSPATDLRSNMTDEAYRKKAEYIIDAIYHGDLYQANLTRKFAGSFSKPFDHFSLFKKLCEASPAVYSAFMRLDDTYVLSSSPELFLHVDAKGHIRTRPIKGTAPRFADEAEDKKSYDALAASEKDKAENLMIVDLMRNDLSRCCVPGSVEASALFEVTSHATIHHMSSTVTGEKYPECSTLQAVKACFPPGSMTGAPKISAMNVCTRMEGLQRGIYSGAIGWFGGDGSCELSVVIRTLVMQGREFEFQVGGGIVADSTPEGELRELIEKSKGILKALGIEPSAITGLS
jgi:anthranilate/para-aminobenzoate synthase component I